MHCVKPGKVQCILSLTFHRTTGILVYVQRESNTVILIGPVCLFIGGQASIRILGRYCSWPACYCQSTALVSYFKDAHFAA